MVIKDYKTLDEKSQYFVQRNIDSLEEFKSLYEEFRYKRDILFRGQREAKWKLYNSLQRNWVNNNLCEKYKSYEDFLEKLVEFGKSNFYSEIRKILGKHNIDTENDIAVLGFLQHHGCPTPLLDWTSNFAVALYFAIDGLQNNLSENDIETYCSVYILEKPFLDVINMKTIIKSTLLATAELTKQIILTKDKTQVNKAEAYPIKAKKILDSGNLFGRGIISIMTEIKHVSVLRISYFDDKDSDINVIFSLTNNKNIINQQGAFVWNREPETPLELIKKDENKADEDIFCDHFPTCICININKNLLPHIKKRLELDGVTKNRIYSKKTSKINARIVFEKAIGNTAGNIGIANSGADEKKMSIWNSIKQWFGLTNKAKY